MGGVRGGEGSLTAQRDMSRKKTKRGWGRGESEGLVYFDSSCQHKEVHYVDWKCDALAMRLHIRSSWKSGEVI